MEKENERDRKTRNQRDRENGHSVPKLGNVGLREEAIHTPRCSPDQGPTCPTWKGRPAICHLTPTTPPFSRVRGGCPGCRALLPSSGHVGSCMRWEPPPPQSSAGTSALLTCLSGRWTHACG